MRIHSVVDLITNSSTELFTYVTDYSVSCVRGIIQTVLDEANSGLNVDDLFEISLVWDNFDYTVQEADRRWEQSDKSVDRDVFIAAFIIDSSKWLETDDLSAYKKVKVISKKTGEEVGIGSMIENTYGWDAEYNG